jgi:mono/diheme cytochrome c family protein
MKRVLSSLAVSCWVAASLRAEPVLTFVKDIQPIFEKHCVSCHGEKKSKGNLRLDTKEHVYGGDSGGDFAVVPGDLQKSLAYTLAITTDEDDLMPPAEEENPLSKEQIATIKKWIEQGAHWDVGDKPANTPNVRKKKT